MAALLWLLPSAGQLDKYLGTNRAIAVAIVVLIAFPIGFRWLASRPAIDDVRAARLTNGIVAALILVFVALFPLVLTHIFGGGSDREDALNVSLRALFHGRYPYFEKTFLGTPPSPLPGALLLALPAWLIWRSALQNLFWMPAFVLYSRRLFPTREAQALFAGVFLLTCPGSMQDYVTGGDYLINCLYVLIATDLAMSVFARDTAGPWQRVAACLFFSICVSSRQNFAIAGLVAGAFIYQQGGVRRFAEFIALNAIFCAAINLPFALYNPAHFPLFNQTTKFHGIPDWVHPSVTLPAIALGVAAASFFVRLDRARAFGMVGASFATLYFLTYAFWFWRFGIAWWIFIEFGYALPVTMFAGVWLMASWRQAGATATTARAAADRETAALPAAGHR